jgi:hypothetical protein
MGRFYSIQISSLTTPAGPTTTVSGPTVIGGVSNGITFTSVVNGVFNPAALLVEFDFFSYVNAASTDGATITIHGVGLANISQAQKFTGRVVQVSAGMSGGLPLEDPTQKGLILGGQIYQAWANWVGTEMNLNLLVYPSRYTYGTPGQFVFNWASGTSLQSALTTTLNTAFPTLGLVFNLSQPYILGGRNVMHNCKTLSELAPFIKSTTATPGFAGVTVSTPFNNTITISDNLFTQATAQPKQIKYTDLIGQPTWAPGPNNAPAIMVTTVMRGDISVGTLVLMPQGPGGPGQVTLTGVGIQQGQIQPANTNYATAFQGQFQVNAIRHIGNSRDTGPTAWVSVLECLPLNIAAAAITPSTATPGAFA